MKIGVDIRPLSSNERSGVGEYTLNLLTHLFKIDQKNKYKLFFNSYQSIPKYINDSFNSFNNVEIITYKYPNKLLNFSLSSLRIPKIDQLLGDVDLFFSPNILFTAISENTPQITTIHDLSFEYFNQFLSLKRKIWHKVVNPKRIARKSDTIVTVSKNTKNDIINKYNISPEKIKVLYSGLEKKFSSIDKSNQNRFFSKYNLPKNYILSLATIEPRKNIIGLIKAYDLLRSSCKTINHKLVIAGNLGWLSKKLNSSLKEIKYIHDIILTGYIEEEEKPKLYTFASLFVYPSFYEGFGFPPLESIACGTPAISSFCSSIPEIIHSNALLINPHNIYELSYAMKTLLLNKNLSDSIVNSGQNYIKKFNWNITASKFLNIINTYENRNRR